MRILVILGFLLALMAPVVAQEASPAASGTAAQEIDALVQIIENDETRALLLERLRQTGAVDAQLPTEPAADLSIARQLAEYTRGMAEGASKAIKETGTVIGQIGRGISGVGSADFDTLRDAVVGVVLTGIGLVGSFLVLRLVVIWLQGRIAARLVGRQWPIRVSGAFGALALDAGSVVLAWAVGYVLALNVIGGRDGNMGINQSLLLNAFLVVELGKVVVRAVLAPRHNAFRLLPMKDDNAAYWAFWISRVVSLLGYTFLFLSPVVVANLSAGAAAGLRLVAMLTAMLIGIVVVLQNKQATRDRLGRWVASHETAGYGQGLVIMGQYWHLLAIAYLVALFVVWVANPEKALPFMIAATMQSVIAIVVGMLVVGFISRSVGIGLRLPEDIRERLPLLEARLHVFVPRVMDFVRWIVLAAVVITIAQAWLIFDFVGWISSDDGLALAGSVISALLIIAFCFIAYVVVASWVEFRLNTNGGKSPTAREKTLLNLFKNAFTVALVVFGIMLALAQIGVNIAPLLAGAGVVGLAIGFGAQKLVQDIITGVFIQFENVMNEGDVVTVGDKSGVVEKLTIRSVTIRDLSGTVHLIPFSSVDQVSNMVRGFSFHVCEMGVAYDSDITAVKQAMQDAFAQLMESEHKDDILDELDMQGVTGFGDSAIMVRARIKTVPGKQWGVGRAYNELLKVVFDERDIEIPYPHVTYVSPAPARSKEAAVPLLPPAPQAGES